MKKVYTGNNRPIKSWASDLETEALSQAHNLAALPFIAPNGVALMADCHAGKGSTVGSVIATDKAIIPAAVGVDIGCGMNAVRLNLKAHQLPDSLYMMRGQIERAVPLGAGGAHNDSRASAFCKDLPQLAKPSDATVAISSQLFNEDWTAFHKKIFTQVGTLGSGNHFIELCIDENEDVWVMLHSGSRGIGNMIGSFYIEKAKEEMERFFIHLPDKDLAYLPEGSKYFQEYMNAVEWAQMYALENRRVMMKAVINAIGKHITVPMGVTESAVECHHNYVARENHFGRNLWITRKGAIQARAGTLGIIPGSMGQKSYIVRGLGNPESYHSCSHGAGRKMSRSQAKKKFTVEDLIKQTEGVECRKDDKVLDEIPGAYKDIGGVMDNQKDLVEVVHTLRAVLCVKGA